MRVHSRAKSAGKAIPGWEAESAWKNDGDSTGGETFGTGQPLNV